jgi:CRP/FNR family transcriptional regulator, anaerobic regulatory protein
VWEMSDLSKFGQFTNQEVEAFEEIANPKLAVSKTLVFEGNKPFNKLLFIKQGIIRTFRLIDGDDYTYFFFANNDFAVDYQSYLTDTISPLYFETLTDTEYFIFNKSDIYALYDKYPRFERLGRIMAESAYLSAADRLKQYQTDDLKTRYLKLISKNPTLFQTVPQHYIASYLGVKPQSLSRIRAEIAGKKY